MKSFIFCTCYVDGNGGETNAVRYSKWISYYRPLLSKMGATHLFLIDDGSGAEYLNEITGPNAILSATDLPSELSSDVNLVSFHGRLGRESVAVYPGWWRSFTFSHVLAEKYGFDKIIHIESDFYIMSTRLAAWLKETLDGWTTLYSRTCNLTESALQVIGKDSLPALQRILGTARDQNYYFDRMAEFILPFTHVNRDFVGDRLGEYGVFWDWAYPRWGDLEFDYIAQLPANIRALSSTQLIRLLRTFNGRATGNMEADAGLLMQLVQDDDLLVSA